LTTKKQKKQNWRDYRSNGGRILHSHNNLARKSKKELPLTPKKTQNTLVV